MPKTWSQTGNASSELKARLGQESAFLAWQCRTKPDYLGQPKVPVCPDRRAGGDERSRDAGGAGAAACQNAKLKNKGPLTLKVSEKGPVSLYGMGRFPVTLYNEQWLRILASAPEIEAFIHRKRDSAGGQRVNKVTKAIQRSLCRPCVRTEICDWAVFELLHPQSP
jgi:hypothetical protein